MIFEWSIVNSGSDVDPPYRNCKDMLLLHLEGTPPVSSTTKDEHGRFEVSLQFFTLKIDVAAVSQDIFMAAK